MKTRRTLAYIMLLTVLGLAPGPSWAQTYQPFPADVAAWGVIRCWSFYLPGWHDRYLITMDGSDTLYGGSYFKNLYITQHHLPGTVNDTLYPMEYFGGLRESGKQVFIFQKWASVDTTVKLVYDFNYGGIGDTIYTDVLSGNIDPVGHLITGIDSVLVGNNYHRRLHLQDIFSIYNTEYWIEGIGSSWGLPFASFWTITDNSYDLSCFYHANGLFYENPEPAFGFCLPPVPAITCDSLLSSVLKRMPVEPGVSLSPNPAGDHVELDIGHPSGGPFEICIHAITGALIRSEVTDQKRSTLFVGDLDAGIYFVLIRSDNFAVSRKLLIGR